MISSTSSFLILLLSDESLLTAAASALSLAVLASSVTATAVRIDSNSESRRSAVIPAFFLASVIDSVFNLASFCAFLTFISPISLVIYMISFCALICA